MQIDNIVLPDGRLEYVNPFESAIDQNIEHATNGAAIITRSAKLAGVSVRLESGNSGFKRNLCEQLLAHSKTLPASFDIILTNGDTHTVAWDYDSNPVEYTPLVRDDSEPSDQLMTNIVLRFITV